MEENMTTECAGKNYRCRINEYIGDDGSYVQTVKMIPLKRKSCPGCIECDDIENSLGEALDYWEHGGNSVVLDDGGLLDGGIYRAGYTNLSTDRESGIVDQYDMEFSRVHDI